MPARFYEDDIGVMATLSAQYHTSGSNSMAGNTGTSRLAMMQARLREQLMVEKESRLLEMAARQEAQRQGTIQRVTKSSASSLSSSLSSLGSSGGQGRVRKLFEERRNNGFNHSPVGWDKSYPLEPVRGGGHAGGGGGRPPVKPARGVVRNNRGVSVDRAKAAYDPAAMRRSRSHAALQRNNNNNNNNNNNTSNGSYNSYGDPRSPQRTLRPPQARQPAHHKSTSSLLDANQNYNGRGGSGSSGFYSRGPSRDASPSPSPSNANRFGFRSRGPSPAPPQAPRRSQTFNAHKAPQDEVDSRGSPEQPRQPPRRPAQPPRQAPARQPLRQPRQPVRQPSPEPENDEEEKLFTPSPRVNKSKSRGPPITHVAAYNGEDRLPKPAEKSSKPKPKLPPKPKAASQATTPRSKITASVPAGLAGCKICGRNFAPDRLEKHESICAKSQAKAKKRKVFDPVKMRTKGTEAETYVKRGAHLKDLQQPKKADWRKKHEDFIATVRAAKGIKGYEAPPMDTSDYVQCPHCGRKFSEGAAERHIPKCASIQSNKPAGGRRR